MAIQAASDINANAVTMNPLNSGNKVQQPNPEVDDKLVAEQKALQLTKVEEAAKAEEKQADNKEEKALEEAVQVIADFMNMPVKNVNFAKADGSDKTVIKVFDSESKELIKQFPSEEALEIAQRIVELRQDVGKKTGILLDENV